MASVLLVSETKIKQFTTINQNTDVELLISSIIIAQDLGLQNLIGGKGYEYYTSLVQQSITSGTPINTIDKTFLENFIAPYLIHRAYYECMPEIYMRRMNKGLIVGNTEQGSAITTREMSYFRDIIQGRYEFYSQRLMDELRNYPDKYAWYYSYTNLDGMPPRKETYFSGIHIGPGVRYPLNRRVYGNLPAYYGGEFDCYDCAW
jgi:hypothetical protein